jgi:hypothetical protein
MGLPSEEMIRAYEQSLASRSVKQESSQIPASTLNAALGFWNLGNMQMSFQGIGTENLACLPWVFAATPITKEYDAIDWSHWDDSVKPTVTALDTLERVAESPAQHDDWKRLPCVEVEGMLQPSPAETHDGKQFLRLVRLRVACCLGDATNASMAGLYRSSIKAKNEQLVKAGKAALKAGDWVALRGRIEFTRAGGKWRAVMRVYEIEKRPIPPKPYL